MDHPFTLARLPVGETAVIAALDHTLPACRRLHELGFAPGGEIRPLFRAPCGDPTAYAVCGTVIALRKQDAEKIFLCPPGKEAAL